MARWISDFDPEDRAYWERTGKRVARRNLIWSIAAENVGFSVWLVWSVVAARLPSAGFRYSTDDLFLLVALPGLVGAIARLPYTFAVTRFGGRNWTVVSALLLLLPSLALATLVARPSTPLWAMALAASTAGLGGGNFASSVANISFFYPAREKGFALGLNAAGGNIGVANVQLVVPLVVGAGLAWAGLVWVPFIVVAAAGAWMFMDNLTTARASFVDQISVAKNRHTWIVAWLYVGTFGSFVGFSAAFPLLTKTQFPAASTNLAFTGALVGSLARPLGGKLADRLGGARVTTWTFAAMAAATIGVIVALRAGSFACFLGAFLVLFVTSGAGNGSTFRMVPEIFRAGRDAAAVLGIASAVGALGGYFIPRGLGASIARTGGVESALTVLVVFYATCIAATWWHYLPRRTPILSEASS
jgi:NNP family nitrate/nitrite transporter-like MFS transporter